MSKSIKLLSIVAACAMAGAPMLKADPNDDAILAQVKQLASQGQDSQVASQVSQFVDENQGLISSIIKMYTGYLKQFAVTASDDGTPSAQTAATSSAPALTESTDPQAAALQPSSGLQASTDLQGSSLQPSSGLQTSSLQPSAGLQTDHLAGYPSLPAVDPITSVTRLTAEQIDYVRQVNADNQARKESLMGHPESYGY
jgi:hypothetical protein